MEPYLISQTIELECPRCKRRGTLSFTANSDLDEINCPECGESIDLVALREEIERSKEKEGSGQH
jgi:Zn ribbon nucleic-acid-binding protein